MKPKLSSTSDFILPTYREHSSKQKNERPILKPSPGVIRKVKNCYVFTLIKLGNIQTSRNVGVAPYIRIIHELMTTCGKFCTRTSAKFFDFHLHNWGKVLHFRGILLKVDIKNICQCDGRKVQYLCN